MKTYEINLDVEGLERALMIDARSPEEAILKSLSRGYAISPYPSDDRIYPNPVAICRDSSGWRVSLDSGHTLLVRQLPGSLPERFWKHITRCTRTLPEHLQQQIRTEALTA